MTNRLFATVFAIGLAAVAWVAAGFVGSSWLALATTVVIGGVYIAGSLELRRFRSTTAALAAALEDIPQPLARLGDWLEQVPPSLRSAVRTRVEGERGVLPAPALTPYLVGLLVMLGMLGTFLGLIVTFKGAVFALEGSTDLQAIRGALAAPIKGLGLSFGTSVAGVAASAMLGLMSAISRRERLDVARLLDSRVATVLHPFSLVHQRQENFKALQAQAQALPDIVARLDAMMERLEQRSQDVDERLLARHAQLQHDVTLAFTGLSESVGASLRENLAAGSKAAGESIAPVVRSAMTQIVDESQRLHARLGELAAGQVDALSQRFGATADAVSERWSAALQEHARTSGALAGELRGALGAFAHTFEQRSGALLAQVDDRMQARTDVEARWAEQHGQRMDQLAGVWRTELAALREQEDRRGEAAVARLAHLELAVTAHLGTLGAALEAPITRMLQTAAEVPQAAGDVITQLREEMSRVAERDNLALQERTVLMGELRELLQAVTGAAAEQRAAIEAMVASGSSVLQQAGAGFAQALEAQAVTATSMAQQTTASAVELAALGEAFGRSMELFQASSGRLGDALERIEASLVKSTARSDEQLAYYVAQAREVIDLSIASQQGVIDSLRRLHGTPGGTLALLDEAGA
jgi:hypothetical protein